MRHSEVGIGTCGSLVVDNKVEGLDNVVRVRNGGVEIGTCGSLVVDNEIEGLGNVVRARNGDDGQLRVWDRYLW